MLKVFLFICFVNVIFSTPSYQSGTHGLLKNCKDVLKLAENPAIKLQPKINKKTLEINKNLKRIPTAGMPQIPVLVYDSYEVSCFIRSQKNCFIKSFTVPLTKDQSERLM